MRIIPRGAAEDCCCSSLKDNVKWLMERIGGTVRKILINGSEYTPDGDGTVTLDTSAFVDVDDHLDDDSMKPIANKPVAEAVQALQDKDTLQDAAITDNAEDISDLQEAATGLAGRIDANTGDIATLQGNIAGLAADNSYTRGLAQAAKDTADGMAERLTDLETNDAVQQGQIGQLIVADQGSAKLAGDNAFTGNNSFAVNPKAAAPASGAVDTSIVNANWVSQTGAGKPNNLLHDLGNEDALGTKRFLTSSIINNRYYCILESTTNITGWIKACSIPLTGNTITTLVLKSAGSQSNKGIFARIDYYSDKVGNPCIVDLTSTSQTQCDVNNFVIAEETTDNKPYATLYIKNEVGTYVGMYMKVETYEGRRGEVITMPDFIFYTNTPLDPTTLETTLYPAINQKVYSI